MVSGDSTPEVSTITDAAKKIYLGGFQTIDKVPRKKDLISNYIFLLSSVYLGLWYECKEKQYFGTYPNLGCPGLHVHSVEPAGFSYTGKDSQVVFKNKQTNYYVPH